MEAVSPVPDEDELLAVAQEAARAAVAELLPRFGRTPIDVRAKSTPTDLVSAADLAAETAIRKLLGRLRPGDAILGEEGGESPGSGELRWLVDPLDGTINYLYGIPVFAVSVACQDAAGTLVGVVVDPVRDEWFAATRSGPATRDGEPICGSTVEQLGLALVATGFSYDADVRSRQAQVALELLPRVRDIRRVGAAALDLCWTACGRYDAFFERGLQAWDHAAGALVCARAGLEVLRLEAGDGLPSGVAAAPPAIAGPLCELVGGRTPPSGTLVD
jgi:myo-inositol-1(or 4)-monophosphatase